MENEKKKDPVLEVRQKFSLKKIKKDQLLILLLAGVLLIIITIPVKKNSDSAKTPAASEKSAADTETKSGGSYENIMEQRLKASLTKVQGVGSVDVMITLKAGKEKVVEKDVPNTSSKTDESDSTGGTRNSEEKTNSESTIYTQGEDGSQVPYVTKEIEPEIEGVIIIAEGGDDPVVIKNISEAVLTLFPIEAHKIKVMKMNKRG